MIYNKFPYRLAIKHLFHKRKIAKLNKDNDNVNKLHENGYIHLRNFISKDVINCLKKYEEPEDDNFVFKRQDIKFNDLSTIFNEFREKKILNLVEKYLGSNIYCYDNTILKLGTIKSKDRAWQPHHDSKGQRVKTYIWLSKYSEYTHPFYYMKKTNNDFMYFKKKNSNLFPEFYEREMDKIFGDIGDLIIFDTNGIHSNFKTTTVPRTVADITFENFGIFSRINDKSENGKKEIKRLSAINLKKYIS